ncbi:MAG: hypothetical protein Q9160_000163 [Pyrenula sp. 1 TL-2023]
MPDLASLTSPGPYHILSYGTLLGTEVFQSFIAGVQAYRVLPRPQFATLQSALFPIYFSMQTALPVVLALTYPGERSATGTTNLGPLGVLADSNRFGVLLPLLTIFATSAANLAIVGPATTNCMRERKHQGKNVVRLRGRLLTCISRNSGREKELRSCTTFQRDDSFEQALREVAWGV